MRKVHETGKGEHALTEWMTAHLQVIAVPVPDADVLASREEFSRSWTRR
jgi:hypothetical protein